MANSAFNHEPSFTIPGSTTDNAVIRWDGTSGGGQLNSGIIIDDSNVITGVTSLTVDNLLINGNTISSTAGTDLLITPLGGQQLILDGLIIIDNGVVTGATSITSTEFHGGGGNLTGISAGTALTGSTNNTITTVTGANAIQGEANLTFDGINLTLTNSAASSSSNIMAYSSMTSGTGSPARLILKTAAGNTADTFMSFHGVDSYEYSIGVDNSDSDKFKISGSALGTNDKFVISTAGAVTMPSQPSFIAKLTTGQNNVTGNTILFRSDNAANSQWTIYENRGSGFANGKFTAPVSGLYHFSLLINLNQLTSSNGYYNLIFFTDTPQTNMSITSSNPWAQAYAASGNLMTRFSILVEMDANDYAYFGGYVYGGSQVVDLEPNTYFTGYLVA